MVRRWRSTIGAALVAFSTGCSGGQTGQPTSLHCDSVTPQSSWKGRSVEAWMAPLEGEHLASLQWLTEEPSSAHARVIELDDEVTIRVEYQGALGTLSGCETTFDVPAMLSVDTTESALSEHALGTVRFSDLEQPAWIRVDGDALTLDASLGAAGVIEGVLRPHVDSAPGAAAIMPAPDGAGGATNAD